MYSAYPTFKDKILIKWQSYIYLCITQIKPLDVSLALLKGIEEVLKGAFKLTLKYW